LGENSRLDPRGIEKLFEAFHTTKEHGLSIGLAISPFDCRES
jgi:C4-dicarboxylate-specific signal transduction histidine kinase